MRSLSYLGQEPGRERTGPSSKTYLHMDLLQNFQDATVRVKTLTEKPSNEHLLQLYSLFKQATDGDVSGEKPGMFDFVGAAKYNAWEQIKGMTKETAMEKYIALVDSLLAGR